MIYEQNIYIYTYLTLSYKTHNLQGTLEDKSYILFSNTCEGYLDSNKYFQIEKHVYL